MDKKDVNQLALKRMKKIKIVLIVLFFINLFHAILNPKYLSAFLSGVIIFFLPAFLILRKNERIYANGKPKVQTGGTAAPVKTVQQPAASVKPQPQVVRPAVSVVPERTAAASFDVSAAFASSADLDEEESAFWYIMDEELAQQREEEEAWEEEQWAYEQQLAEEEERRREQEEIDAYLAQQEEDEAMRASGYDW